VETGLAESTIARRAGVAGITPDDFDSIVRCNQRRIYRLLLLYLRDADAADTLTQECFLRAFETRARFRGECSLETWLCRIAVNLVGWRNVFVQGGAELPFLVEDIDCALTVGELWELYYAARRQSRASTPTAPSSPFARRRTTARSPSSARK
jgi:hypothetical protein